MDGDEFLLAEYKRFAESFWKNEEVGEKRINFYITLVTAVLAGIIALATSEKVKVFDYSPLMISTTALSGVLIFGLATFLRMLQRNLVTDEYKRILDYIREHLRRRSANLPEYELPFFKSKLNRWLRGGLAETTGLMNCFVLAVILALWFGVGRCWWVVAGYTLLLGILQGVLIYLKQRKRGSRGQTFRAGVGAIIRNAKGEVLAFERKDKPGCWQLPQGGMEIGEDPLNAVFREIYEETRIKKDKLQQISKTPPLLAYELPDEYRSKKTGRGQAIYWFVFNFTGTIDDICLDDSKEFEFKKWTTMDDLIGEVIEFKKPVYLELKRRFSHLLHRR